MAAALAVWPTALNSVEALADTAVSSMLAWARSSRQAVDMSGERSRHCICTAPTAVSSSMFDRRLHSAHSAMLSRLLSCRVP